jgi:hypothetical protein
VASGGHPGFVRCLSGVAFDLGSMVLASAIAPERKTPVRAKPQLGAAMEFIDEILRVDQRAPRKQRHTAHRIWERIRSEKPEITVAESTVRHPTTRQRPWSEL